MVGRKVTELQIRDGYLVMVLDYGIAKVIIKDAEIEYTPGPLEHLSATMGATMDASGRDDRPDRETAEIVTSVGRSNRAPSFRPSPSPT